ncbi:MAG: hypothetical protein HY299_07020 [Verrucomicrobia bacterium]|nr:hypothetical protein [Verrucomicrobiota bacterium]
MLSSLLCGPLSAGIPTLEHLYPMSVAPGATNIVQAIGSISPWPPKIWVEGAGVDIQPQTNAGMLRVVVAPNAIVGPRFVRVFNDEGASGPRFLAVAREPLTAEVEPNDEFKKPQQITALPGWVNGRLDKGGDVDSYSVSLQRGETLIAKVESYVLASPVDAVLRVLDPSHVQVALNHDDGETFDPFVAWTARQDGEHVVQVFGFVYPAGSDVRFTGGNSSVYRLWLSKGPYARHTVPLGVQKGREADLECIGWNLPGPGPHRVHCPAQAGVGATGLAWFQPPGIENLVRVCVGAGPELVEREPNNRVSDAGELPIPSSVTGSLSPANDEDRFQLLAKPGDHLLLRVRSASLGFNLDPWLKIEDKEGRELARNDDSVGSDPALDWTVSGTNVIYSVVGNLVHRSDPRQLYRLSVERAEPSLEMIAPAHSFTMKAGETNEVKVTLKRSHGFNAKVTVTTEGLPSGVSTAAVEVPEQGAEAKLSWIAPTGAVRFNGPIRIRASPLGGASSVVARFPLVSSGSDNGVPNGFGKLLIDSIDQLWLTITPAPAPPAAPKK